MTTPPSVGLAILNSVIQYFPSQSYLLDVIHNIIQLGQVETIFFGDVRSYALYEQFLVTKVLQIAGENSTTHGALGEGRVGASY